MKEKYYHYGNEKFSLIVDILGASIKGIFLYTVFLWIDFRLYQGGKGMFTPIQDMLIVPAFVIVFLVGRVLRNSNDGIRYAGRYRSNESFRWGVYMALVLLGHSITSNPRSEHIPVSPKVCGDYMVGAFIVYLVLVVMLRYVFLQYDHYRQKSGMDRHTFRRLRRMNIIVAVLVTILILTAMYFSSETIVKAIMWVLEHIIGYALAGFFFGLSKLEVKQVLGMDIVEPDYEAKLRFANKYQELKEPSGGVSIEMILLVALAVWFVVGLIRLYKKRGANYTLGQDTAEYIRAEENKLVVSRAEKRQEREQFGNSNREKIRKHYYKTMNSRIDKSEIGEVSVKTTEELRTRYEKRQDGTNLQVMTNIYQKARYSNEVCSNEDVEKVTSIH